MDTLHSKLARKPGLFLLIALVLASCGAAIDDNDKRDPFLQGEEDSNQTTGLGQVGGSGGLSAGGIPIFGLVLFPFYHEDECVALRRVGISLPYSDEEIEQISNMGLDICLPIEERSSGVIPEETPSN